MVLPNFFVLGTPKSATRSLATYFTLHPDVCFTQVSEPHFFAREEAWQRGEEWYRSLFAHYAGEKAIGEKSWRYACFDSYPEAWDRLTAAVPEFKAIYVAREPLARASSMWRELRDAAQDRVHGDPGHSINHDRLIVETSLYYRQISRVIEAIGRDNLLLLTFEDFCADQQAVFDQICDFLDIRKFAPSETIRENPSIGQSEDGRIAEILRSAGAVDFVARHFPALKPIGRTLLRRPLTEVVIDDADKARFLAMVEDDNRKFLALAGKPENFWELARQRRRAPGEKTADGDSPRYQSA